MFCVIYVTEYSKYPLVARMWALGRLHHWYGIVNNAPFHSSAPIR